MTLKITSDFAILDVKQGRQKLAELLTPHDHQNIPVTITGFLTHVHSDDDGTSIEFGVAVTSVTIQET